MTKLITPVPYFQEQNETQLANERRFRTQVEAELRGMTDQIALLKKQIGELADRIYDLENP